MSIGLMLGIALGMYFGIRSYERWAKKNFGEGFGQTIQVPAGRFKSELAVACVHCNQVQDDPDGERTCPVCKRRFSPFGGLR